MANVLLGLFVCLVVIGSFTLSSSVLDTRMSINQKMGRMIRGLMTEALGFIFFIIALKIGGKITLALPMVVFAISIGSIVGLGTGLVLPKLEGMHAAKKAAEQDKSI